MRRTLKDRLTEPATAAPLLASFVQLPSPEVVELYAIAGFDLVVLDLEHGAFGVDTLRSLLMAADARGVAAVVRVPEPDPTLIAKVLDLGAAGIMVPQVRSAADVEDVVRAARYAPEGARGYCSGVRSTAYDSPPTFTRTANAETVVIPLVENLDAVAAFDAILGTEGVSAVMLGPGDLSASLGFPGDWEREEVRGVLEDLVARAVERATPVGMHVKRPEDAADWRRKGVRFVTYGMDAQMFLRQLSSVRAAILAACDAP